jgi:branched-subunit amino acid aminotransferase/4-amino-4-deoxychorismate lyase
MKILRGIVRHSLLGLLIPAALSLQARAQEKTLSADDLAQRSDVIVVGKVSNLHSAWTADKSRIVTTVTLQVDQSLKGAPGTGTMTVITPGGEVDGVGELYSHCARFVRDENVVVFAKRNTKGDFSITAGQQGKMSVRKDPETGILMVDGRTSLAAFTRHFQKSVKTGN